MAGGILGKLKWPFHVVSVMLVTFADLFRNPETVSVSYKNLQQQQLRRNLTLLGIVIGIAAITTLVALGDSLNVSIEKQFQQLGLNTLFVEPGGVGFETAFSRVPKEDVQIIEGIPNVERVIPFYEAAAIASKQGKSASVFLIGIKPEHQQYLVESGYINLVEGRWLNDNDSSSIIVYQNFLDTAFEDESLKLRSSLEINDKKFSIVGISKQSDLGFANLGFVNMAFVTDETVQRFFGEDDPTELVVIVSNKSVVAEVSRRIEQRLEREHGEKNFSVLTSENILDIALQVLGVVQFFVMAIASIALIVGGIGIMNTMFMAVTERTREIGTMKAIGATDQKIRSLFLAESGILGLSGGVIGIVLGIFLTVLIVGIATANGFTMEAVIRWQLVVGAVLFSFILGVVSGIPPSEKAMALDPVEAIRYE